MIRILLLLVLSLSACATESEEEVPADQVPPGKSCHYAHDQGGYRIIVCETKQ